MDNTFVQLEFEEVARLQACIARHPDDPPVCVEGEIVVFRCWKCKVIHYLRNSLQLMWKPTKDQLCRYCSTPLFIGEGEE